jgi:hypothetical protein
VAVIRSKVSYHVQMGAFARRWIGLAVVVKVVHGTTTSRFW